MGRYHYLGHTVPFGAHLRYLVFASRPARAVVGCLQFSSRGQRPARCSGRARTAEHLESKELENNSPFRCFDGLVIGDAVFIFIRGMVSEACD